MARKRSKSKRRQMRLIQFVSWVAFLFVLVSVFSAYISNQVKISTKKAALVTLDNQIEQQRADNQELERILSGDPDEVMEWIARESYGFAGPNERIFIDISGN